MQTRKIPMRQCVGCREMKQKKELIRVVKTPDDQIVLDVTGKQNGRGAYICNCQECLNKAMKSSALERSLKTKVSQEVYEELERQMKSNAIK